MQQNYNAMNISNPYNLMSIYVCRIYYNICCSQTFSRSGTCPNGNGERVLWRQHTKRTIHVCNHTIRCDTTANTLGEMVSMVNMRWRIPHPHPLVAVAVPLCSHAMPLFGLQHHPDPHRRRHTVPCPTTTAAVGEPVDNSAGNAGSCGRKQRKTFVRNMRVSCA